MIGKSCSSKSPDFTASGIIFGNYIVNIDVFCGVK